MRPPACERVRGQLRPRARSRARWRGRGHERAAVLVEEQRDHARGGQRVQRSAARVAALGEEAAPSGRPAAGASLACRLSDDLRRAGASASREHRRLVQGQDLAVAHHHPALDDDVRARRRPWPRRRGGRRRRRAGWRRGAARSTTTRSARLPASSEPDAVLHAQRARAAQGRHLQHGGRGGRRGVAASRAWPAGPR